MDIHDPMCTLVRTSQTKLSRPHHGSVRIKIYRCPLHYVSITSLNEIIQSKIQNKIEQVKEWRERGWRVQEGTETPFSVGNGFRLRRDEVPCVKLFVSCPILIKGLTGQRTHETPTVSNVRTLVSSFFLYPKPVSSRHKVRVEVKGRQRWTRLIN